jgi:hypothetical protein
MDSEDQSGASDDHQDGDGDEFAHEDDLRDQANRDPLGGADLEHCQRMRG